LICDNHSSSKGFKLLFPVIKAIKIYLYHFEIAVVESTVTVLLLVAARKPHLSSFCSQRAAELLTCGRQVVFEASAFDRLLKLPLRSCGFGLAFAKCSLLDTD